MLKLATPALCGTRVVWSADQDDTLNTDYLARIDGRESWACPVQNSLKGPGPSFTPRTDGDLTQILGTIRNYAPHTNIFTYIDSTILDDITDTQDGYQIADPKSRLPGPDLPGCVFSLSELLKYESGPNLGQYYRPYRVDVRIEASRNKLLATIKSEMLARQALGYSGVRTDNWLCREIDGAGIYPLTLAQELVYFRLLNEMLHSIGFYHIANIGYTAMSYPTVMSDDQLDQIARADVVDFEQVDNPAYFATQAAVNEWLRKAKRLIDGGCCPDLLPTTAYNPPGTYPGGYIAGILFYNGMACALDNSFVSVPLFVDRLSVQDVLLTTPKLMGTTTVCAARTDSSLVVQRGLTKKTVVVDTVSRAATFITIGGPTMPVQALGRYQIVDGAIQPCGYQQITDVSGVTNLTVPAGANTALIQVEGSQVRWVDDGTNPSAGIGMFIPVNGGQWYVGDLGRLKLIQDAAGAKLNVSYYRSG
jgi:hypothetical protein